MKTIYLVEGECERVFIKQLWKKGLLRYIGKCVEMKLIENIISGRESLFNMKVDRIYAIVDLDKLQENEAVLMGRFKKNCKTILNIFCGVQIVILAQNKNFEDELQRATGKEIKDIFKTRTNSDAKTKMIKSANLVSTLQKNSINFEVMWAKHEPLSLKCSKTKVDFLSGLDVIICNKEKNCEKD